MEILKYLRKYRVYVLINLIILILGFYLIDTGLKKETVEAGSGNIYVSIGTSLIAAGIVMFLDVWRNLSVTKILKKIKNIINDGGIEKVYSKRDIDKYEHLMNKLSESLDIAGYSLGGFFDSFSHTLKEKLSKSDLKVRVLFVDPTSESSKKRASVEGKTEALYQERLTIFSDFFRESKGLEIRLIDAPLSSMIFRIDHTMFIGPHFYGRQSKATFTMELRRRKWIFEEYQKEFDRMWEASTPHTIPHTAS